MNASIIDFDVNETLTDMSPMGQKFVEVGAPAYLAKLWFATLLRDGFALTASRDSVPFATIGAESLRSIFTGMPLKSDIESAVQHVMTGFTGLGLHPDVIEGVNALHAAGYRLATLTNGSTAVHKKLFEGRRHSRQVRGAALRGRRLGVEAWQSRVRLCRQCLPHHIG